MTLTEAQERIRRYAGRSPHHLIELSVDADLTAWINERLRDWTRMTECFYTSSCQVTLTATTAVYDLEDTAVFDLDGSTPIRMYKVFDVFIDDAPLRTLEGDRGPIGQQNYTEVTPTHLVATDGKPKYWSNVSPKSIRLYPAPDDAYSDNFVTGIYYPVDLSSGSDEVGLPLSHDDYFCMYAAGKLLMPKTGDDEALGMKLLGQGMAFASEALADFRSSRRGSSIRGKHRRGPTVELGY